LAVISYSQASRRFKKLNIKISDCRADKSNMEDIEIAIDSTSISIYNNTPGRSKENSEDKKYRVYEQVRKLHVMLNINDKKAIAAKYNNGVYSDHYGACNLLEEVNFQHTIKALYADRVYDRYKLYKLCKEYDIKTKVLPKNGEAEHSKIDYMSDRNVAIRLIKLYGEDGVKEWKKEANYGKRSYIKGFFSRLKQIFGYSLWNKSEVNREKELLIKCYLLNTFTDIGMAKFEIAT